MERDSQGRPWIFFSRREFIGGAAAVGASLAGLGLAGRARAAVREVRIEAREVQWELAPGRVIKAMTYNGRVPGPEIRVKEGERVRVVLTNALSEPTTVHWHGVDVPNAMDGVPDVTQAAVRPGETFAYEFEARPAGTRWYHTHFEEPRQMDLGLVAPLIIEPAVEAFPFDREYTLVLDDWATGTGPTLPPTEGGTAAVRGEPGGMMTGMTRRQGGMQGRGGMMGRGVMGGGMRRGGHEPEPAYDLMTINGKAYPATEPLRVRKGERVRLRFVNASADHTHVIRLVGHRLKVTHTDGNPLVEPVEVDAVPLAPAERYDVLVTADRPGAWFLYCAAPGHAKAGEQVLLLYEDQKASRPAPVVEGVKGLRLWRYEMGQGRDGLPSASGALRVFAQTLAGGMDESNGWTINGRRYPGTDPIQVRTGDRVRIRVRNMSPEAHPMHLHGQSFRVVAFDGRALARPLAKDTVDIEPHMGTAEIEFTAHNPGDWFWHCHKPDHMEGGMIALVKIAG
jgi:FtsP/CotA-like multicopper oxidase with cupredoxin domain